MSIKSEADGIYFSAHRDEREIALRLNDAFDVTHGQTHGQLGFWLLQPTTRTSERFGLQKEVLAIYSSHPTTDARVLTAIENIIRMPEFKHRLEKVLFLVIHKGDDEKTKNILNSDKEKVIVSITVSDILSPTRGDLFVRSKIADSLGVIDLFGMSSPLVSERYFFGRNELVQQLLRKTSVLHQNIGVFGLRKTGKTSVIFAIKRMLESQSILSEYFDCQNPGIQGARWWQVLGNISTKLQESVKNNFNKRIDIIGRYSPDTAGTAFSTDIQTLLKTANLNHISILMDEIEWITPQISGLLGRHWDDDFIPFWQTIRATHQETQGKLTFLVAGVNPLCVQRSHFGILPNPIFQLAIPHYLESFSTMAVREMVRTIGRYAGLKFDESTYDYLQRTYGGHPYLIRITCSELWQKHRTVDPVAVHQLSNRSFSEVRPSIRVRLAQPIKDILLSLVWWYPEEYDLLQILAEGDTKFVQDYIKDNPDSVLQFAKYGLLRPETGEFAIEDIRGFLQEFGAAYKKELSPFTRSDIQPNLLPEMPNLELLGRLFEKKCTVETKLRRLVIMYLGFKHNWNPQLIAGSMKKGLPKRADRPNPEDLFVGRSPKDVINSLYTLDMKTIIIKNWGIFSNVFDNNLPRFEMNLDAINVARQIDGHTKPVTTEEAEAFENSYQWILLRLKDIPLENAGGA